MNILNEKRLAVSLLSSALVLCAVYVLQLLMRGQSTECCDNYIEYGWPLAFYRSGGFSGDQWLILNLIGDLLLFAGVAYFLFPKSVATNITKKKKK